jgi:hypothetical protein
MSSAWMLLALVAVLLLRTMDFALADRSISGYPFVCWGGCWNNIPYFLPRSAYIPCRVDRCLARSFLLSLVKS